MKKFKKFLAITLASTLALGSFSFAGIGTKVETASAALTSVTLDALPIDGSLVRLKWDYNGSLINSNNTTFELTRDGKQIYIAYRASKYNYFDTTTEANTKYTYSLKVTENDGNTRTKTVEVTTPAEAQQYKDTYKVGNKTITNGKLTYFKISDMLFVASGDNRLVTKNSTTQWFDGWAMYSGEYYDKYQSSTAKGQIEVKILPTFSPLEKRALDPQSHVRQLYHKGTSIEIPDTYPVILAPLMDMINAGRINKTVIGGGGYILDALDDHYSVAYYDEPRNDVYWRSYGGYIGDSNAKRNYNLLVTVKDNTMWSGAGTEYDPYIVSAIDDTPKLDAPEQPVVLKSEAGNVQLSWNASAGALLYKVLRNGSEIGTVATTNYTDTTAVKGSSYIYSIQAFDGVTTSPASPFVLVSVTDSSASAISAPTNLTKVTGNFTSNTISWDSVEGATSYKVKVDSGDYLTVSGTTYTDKTVLAGTSKTYVVRAVKDGVESEDSSPLVIDTGNIPAIENLKVDYVGSNRVDLSWNQVPGITIYVITRNDGQWFQSEGYSKFSDTSAEPETSYTYEVKPQAGNLFGDSMSVETKTKDSLTSLVNVKIVEATTDSIELSWDEQAGADKYEISINVGGVAQATTVTTGSYVKTGLSPDTEYQITMGAVSGTTKGTTGTLSVRTKAVVSNKLPAPTNLIQQSASDIAIGLKWDDVEGAEEYIIKRNGSEIATIATTSYEDKGLPNKTEYTYKVAAIKDGVEGEYATLVASTLDPTVKPKPVAPTLFTAVKGDSKDEVLLTWDGTNETIKVVLTANGLPLAELSGSISEFRTTGKLGSTVVYGISIQSNDGPFSDEKTVSYKFPSAKVTAPRTLTVQDVTYQNVALSWNATENADGYELYRDGVVVMPTADVTYFEDTTVEGGRRYVYSVKAIENGNYSAAVNRVVNTPNAPEVGVAPDTEPTFKVLKAYSDRVNIQIDPVPNATKYELLRDGLKVYEGSLNLISDVTVSESTTYSYVVKAINEWGETESSPVEVTTPAAPQQVVVAPAEPKPGQVTMSFKEITEAEWYEADRNPNWKITPLGDGTYNLHYSNEVTGDTKDYGNFPITDGSITFFEENVDPSRDYHYEITAIKRNAKGDPEVIGKTEVEVTTPDDNSGATIPGGTVPPVTPPVTPPGDSGTTTPPAGGGNEGTTTPPVGGGTTPPVSGGSGQTTPPVSGGSGGSTSGGTSGGSSGGSTSNGTSGGSGSVGSGTSTENNNSSTPENNGSGVPQDKEETEEAPSVILPTDIKGHYAEKQISDLISKGIIKGYSDGTFAPSKEVSRAEFAIMLKRAMGYESAVGTTKAFKDLDMNSWYGKELSEALSSGVTKGYNDGTYRPNNKISRQEASIMISNVLLKELDNHVMNEAEFKDYSSITAWAVDGVNLASSYGIIKGYTDGNFYPKKNITRAETAVMIFNLLEALSK